MIRLRWFGQAGAILASSLALVGGAFAQDAANTKAPQPAAPASAPAAATASGGDDSLTWKGFTFYGVIDVDVVHQTRGAPLNLDATQGVNYSIGKASRKSMTVLAPNGLTPSFVGLKGNFALSDDISAIFNLQAGFDPLSLKLADGPRSLIDNNGRALTKQSASGDSNQAGQLDNTAGFVGLTSKTWGTATWGRQNGLLADKIIEYDPNGASYAFSEAGGSNAVRGIGDSQDARLNSSLKYFAQYGPIHFGAQYQPSGKQYALYTADGSSGSAHEYVFGGNYKTLSADLVYSQKNGAISASSLSAAQLKTLPADTLAATVSDNTSYTALASATFDAAKVYAGYEHIRFANPSSPLKAGTQDLGDYVLSVLTQTAYTNNKILKVEWVGVKYTLTPKFYLTGAFYTYRQNSYATGKSAGCSNNSSSACSGSLDAFSITGVYSLYKHLDVYGGVMRSGVSDGLASGYLYTSNYNTVVGGRFTF